MIRAIASLALLALMLGGCGNEREGSRRIVAEQAETAPAALTETAPAQASIPIPNVVKVRFDTEAGPILLALDYKRAPITTKNFMRYVDARRYDGTTFYRAAPTAGAKGGGFIQGGIRRNYRLMFPPIAHEPTSRTGLRHEAGTISMARGETGAGAMGEYFITASAMSAMDARPGDEGYAAFGRVTEGMDNVRKILAAPTIPNAGRGKMRGQMIAKPVKVVSARRMN